MNYLINYPMRSFAYYILGICIIACTMGCETDIPVTDTIAPSFSFKIMGDGFDQTFTQDDDLENIQLNLRAGVTYDFLLGGIDNGGVRQIQLQHTPDATPISTAIPSPWTVINNGLTVTIQLNGDSNNALTAHLLPGAFTATLGSETIIADSFYIRVEDFGGESGPFSNITEGILNITIANQETQLINL